MHDWLLDKALSNAVAATDSRYRVTSLYIGAEHHLNTVIHSTIKAIYTAAQTIVTGTSGDPTQVSHNENAPSQAIQSVRHLHHSFSNAHKSSQTPYKLLII